MAGIWGFFGYTISNLPLKLLLSLWAMTTANLLQPFNQVSNLLSEVLSQPIPPQLGPLFAVDDFDDAVEGEN